MMEQQVRLQMFLRIMKKAHKSAMCISTLEGDKYKVQYIKDERLWRVSYIHTKGAEEVMVDMKKNINKLLDRIDGVTKIVIKNS